MKQPVLLRVYRGDKLIAIKQFTEAQIVIGHNADVLLELDDPGVTPLHCIIEERDSGYYVVDLGSMSGTIHNGKPVLDQKLNSGDELQIGPFRLEFFIGVPKPTKTPPVVAGVPVPPTTSAPGFPPPVSNATLVQPTAPTVQPTPPPVAKSTFPPPAKPADFPPAANRPTPPPARPAQPVPPSAAVTPAPTAVPVGAPYSQPAANLPKDVPKQPEKKPDAGGPQKAWPTSKGTFAPPSQVKDLRDVVKPDKGTSVEVIVAWKERVIATNHYNLEAKKVTIGAHVDNDISVPLIGLAKVQHTLLDINQRVMVILTPEMKGELIREGRAETFNELQLQNRLIRLDAGYSLQLQQGEMVRIVLDDGLLNIFVRFVPETAKPLLAPILDLSVSELTTLIGALLLVLMFGIYNMVYSPNVQDEKVAEEQIRKATVIFSQQKPPAPPPEPVKVTEQAPQKKSETPAKQPLQTKDPGQAKKVEGRKTNQPKNNKKITSANPGGGINTGAKAASAQTVKPDPSSMGILSVFGKSGTQEKINKAASGAGELIGAAESAKGKTGDNESRPGDFGTKLKDTGAGGKGTATVNIQGVGTKGAGTGIAGTGEGGLGQRAKVEVQIGGAEEDFVGTIDREAVRRVILDNRNSFRSCYNDELRRDSSVFGKLLLKWVIAEGGRVKTVSVQSTAFSPAMTNCIAGRLKILRFPSPPADQEAEVVYPFVFSAQ